MTKTSLSERMGISRRTYQNWLDDPSVLTPDRLEMLAEALEMGEESRAVLYELSGRAIPVRSGGGVIGAEDLKMHRQMIDGIAHPALLQSRCWDVLLTNKPFRDMYTGVKPCGRAMPTKNPMRYILFNPAAYEFLGGTHENFFEGWLMPAFAAFAAVKQQIPNDPQILDMEEGIGRRSGLLRAYRSTPDWIREHNDLHVNSEARPFVHPELGLTDVQLLTEAHLGWQPVGVTRTTFIFPALSQNRSEEE